MTTEFERKHHNALNTFVREKWDVIPEEMEVKLKSLKAWGFDLISGLRGGQAAVFVAPTEKGRAAGDIYEEEGETFEVQEVIKQLPKNERLTIQVTLQERRGVIEAFHHGPDGEPTLLFSLPAGELLLAYFKKRRLHHLIQAFHSSGLTTEFILKRGEEGLARDFDELPPKMRRLLREAWAMIRKEVDSGRFTLVYYGEDKDHKPRFALAWLLPTIQLFHVDVAEKADKLLATVAT